MKWTQEINPSVGEPRLGKLQAVEPPPGPADDGTVGLAMGIVALTVVAGLTEVVRRLRGSEAWPVPLVIYATLLPIVLFLLLGASRAGEPIDFAYAALEPLPLLGLTWWIKRPRGAERP